MRGARTKWGGVERVIHHRSFVDATLPTPALEQAAAAATFSDDVRAVVDAARPFEATLVMLGEFAIVKLSEALQRAAGRPHDARWHAAYSALSDFVAYDLRHSAETGGYSFERLVHFLIENEDLARNTVADSDPEDAH